MEIRLAAIEDTETVLALYRVLFGELAALQPDSFESADQDRGFVQDAIRDEHADVLLAAVQGITVGFAMVRRRTTPAYPAVKPQLYAHLMDLAVLPPYRGRGAGTALLCAVRAWGWAQRCAYVELSVLEENKKAQRLYRSQGYRPSVHTLRTPLA